MEWWNGLSALTLRSDIPELEISLHNSLGHQECDFGQINLIFNLQLYFRKIGENNNIFIGWCEE